MLFPSTGARISLVPRGGHCLVSVWPEALAHLPETAALSPLGKCAPLLRGFWRGACGCQPPGRAEGESQGPAGYSDFSWDLRFL